MNPEVLHNPRWIESRAGEDLREALLRARFTARGGCKRAAASDAGAAEGAKGSQVGMASPRSDATAAVVLEQVPPAAAMALLEVCHPSGVRVLEETRPALAGFRDRVVLCATPLAIQSMAGDLPREGPLATIAAAVDTLLEGLAAAACPQVLLYPGGSLDLAGRVKVMGVLNVTPDSFSDGGRFLDPPRAADHARRLEDAGADLVDIGGESTRPGADAVSLDEERRRVLPVLERLAGRLHIPVSIDTRKARLAREAIGAGARLVNDVSALEDDPAMAAVVAETKVPVVLMHRRGTSRTMQHDPHYEDPVAEILRELRARIEGALRSGITRDRIVLDPGVGFGKRVRDNLEILARLGEFRVLGDRLLVGTSRKSFLGAVTGAGSSARLLGTAATVVVSALRGARIVRVHDVGEMVEALRVVHAIETSAGERD